MSGRYVLWAVGIVIGISIGFVAGGGGDMVSSYVQENREPTATVNFNQTAGENGTTEVVVHVSDYKNASAVVATANGNTYYANKSDDDRVIRISDLENGQVFSVKAVQKPRLTNAWTRVEGDEKAFYVSAADDEE